MHDFSWSNKVAKSKAHVKGMDCKVLLIQKIKFIYKSKLNLIVSNLSLIFENGNLNPTLAKNQFIYN